jgi:hypothetical protein
VNSFLGALCTALAITLVVVLLVITFPSEFWHVKITDVLLFAATVALVGSTIALWLSAQRSTEITERAYVNLSHTSPGAKFEAPGFSLQVQVKNAGRTPASIIDLLLKYAVVEPGEALPAVPDYSTTEPHETQELFIASGEPVFVGRTFAMTDEQVRRVKDGSLGLYVYGYVDYLDVFNKAHKSGYARIYDPSRDVGPIEKRNNLNLYTSKVYNYDKPLPGWS